MEYRIIRTGHDDELYHWKYVSKKKVNGKWRYYYDNGGKTNDKRSTSIEEELKPWENGTEAFDMLMDSPLHGIGARLIEKAFSALINEGKKWYEMNRNNRPVVSVNMVGPSVYKRR